MQLALIKVNKTRWVKTGAAWLKPGDIEADPLADLKTTENKLSAWHIDEKQARLDQLLAALAANRETFDKLDYALFDKQIVTDLGIKAIDSLGGLPDPEVNNWHFDMVELSGATLVSLAKEIQNKAKMSRVTEPKAIELVKNFILRGRIDRKKLKNGLKDKIEELLRNS